MNAEKFAENSATAVMVFFVFYILAHVIRALHHGAFHLVTK